MRASACMKTAYRRPSRVCIPDLVSDCPHDDHRRSDSLRLAGMAENAPTVLLRNEDSDGQVAVVELTGGGRPLLHLHNFDETFYVLEGELTFRLGDDLVDRRAGELAFAPRGAAHTYANLSWAPARALLVMTPAGFERYFARMAVERQGVEPPIWRCDHSPRSRPSETPSVKRRRDQCLKFFERPNKNAAEAARSPSKAKRTGRASRSSSSTTNPAAGQTSTRIRTRQHCSTAPPSLA